jgi:hypothetical protein
MRSDEGTLQDRHIPRFDSGLICHKRRRLGDFHVCMAEVSAFDDVERFDQRTSAALPYPDDRYDDNSE